MNVTCLTEQQDLPAIAMLRAAASVEPRPLAELAANGWDRPLVALGEVTRVPEVTRLVRRAYGNPAPLLIVAQLPAGDLTSLLDTPAPVAVVRQRAERVDLIDAELRRLVGREQVQVLCTEAVETALRTGDLATAGGRPVIWAYQPTRAATPVVWIAPQVLLVSARSDPMDREDLLAGLLAWAAAHTRPAPDAQGVPSSPAAQADADHGLVRALVVAWSVRPDLTVVALPGWLEQRLHLPIRSPEQLQAAIDALDNEDSLDDARRPNSAKLAHLANDWGLRAWIREAGKLEETAQTSIDFRPKSTNNQEVS